MMLESLLKPSIKAVLLKGEPGVGKTTLALELLKMYGRGLYVSTRVSEEQISEYNPLIKDLVDSGKVLEVKLQQRVGRRKKKEEKEERGKGKGVMFEDLRLGVAQDIIQVVLEAVTKKSPEPMMIVLDSWDSVAKEVDSVERLKIEKSLLALAEANDAKVIFISEEPNLTTTDYLVDGMVTLKNEFLEGDRRIRKVEWNKVRGSPIPQPSYVYSLHDGRFNMFQAPEILSNSGDHNAQRFKPINHKEEFYSTGNQDLDAFLGGGIRKGSVTLVELGKNVPLRLVLPAFGTTMCNVLANGGCNVAIPTADAMPDTAIGLVSPYIPEKIVNSNLRVGIYGDFRHHPCLFMLDPSSAAKTYEIFWKQVENVKGAEGKPCRWYIGVDALEAMYGTDDIMKYTMMSIHKVKQFNDFLTLVAKDRTQTKQLLSDLSDTHVKFDEVDGALLFYSVKPQTQAYSVDYDYSNGYPSLKLTPVI
jgi:KaiC/GvpD/RAD55 family RecA-like ATPase